MNICICPPDAGFHLPSCPMYPLNLRDGLASSETIAQLRADLTTAKTNADIWHTRAEAHRQAAKFHADTFLSSWNENDAILTKAGVPERDGEDNLPVVDRIELLISERDSAQAACEVKDRALRDVDRVRKSMAQTGKDFFIDGAQRAFPLLCNGTAALSPTCGTDILDRLRDAEKEVARWCKNANNMADQRDSLRTRIAELERERDYWKKHYEEKEKPALVLAEQNLSLSTQVATLRAALEKWVQWTRDGHGNSGLIALESEAALRLLSVPQP